MSAPRYRALVDRISADIHAGRLVAGKRLPTHRALAARERIAVATATRVYAELEAVGLVSREPGRGTFVRDLTLRQGHGIDQQTVALDVVDLNFNYPSVPGQADLLRAALRDLAGAGDLEALLRYQPHGGRPQDRASVTRYLNRHELFVEAQRVLLVSGAQHGLAIAVMATLQAGDIVAVDDLTYPGFKVLADALRLELVPVATTPTGPDLDALERLCATRPVRAIYVMPTLHNPLGWVMNSTSRRRLTATARRHDLLLIEDASYAYLAEDPPPPLVAIAPERTVHVSGLSKSVATGLRLGYVVAPLDMVSALERAIRATTWHVPPLTTAIACRWLDDGTVDHLETLKRSDARARQRVVHDELADLGPIGHPASYFTWLPLPEGARADRLAATLARERISVSTAEPFTTSTRAPQALRLALGSTDVDRLRASLRVVHQSVLADAAT